jgi:hypothetical protein
MVETVLGGLTMPLSLKRRNTSWQDITEKASVYAQDAE